MMLALQAKHETLQPYKPQTHEWVSSHYLSVHDQIFIIKATICPHIPTNPSNIPYSGV